MKLCSADEGTNHYECTKCGKPCYWVLEIKTLKRILKEFDENFFDEEGNYNYRDIRFKKNEDRNGLSVKDWISNELRTLLESLVSEEGRGLQLLKEWDAVREYREILKDRITNILK